MDQLIIERGSTKSEWVLFDPEGNVLSRAIAPGWNPQLGLESNQISTDCQSMIDHAQSIYFYSAGVASPITKERVIQKLNAPCKVEVFSDLEGACKASLGETSGVVGILGTGSNACYWDGTMTHHAVPSLGFILSEIYFIFLIINALNRLFLWNITQFWNFSNDSFIIRF